MANREGTWARLRGTYVRARNKGRVRRGAYSRVVMAAHYLVGTGRICTRPSLGAQTGARTTLGRRVYIWLIFLK
jgi:hypothetical protein